MLDEFKNNQFKAYNLIENECKKNKFSHAYLIDTNNFSEYKNFVYAFVKYLFCENHYTNREKCLKCNICDNVDKKNYPELEIIETSNLWIKKEELMNLKQKLSKKGVQNSKKIYIIFEAEKLNGSSANSILKFLEEPEEGIIAILVTNNIRQVLETIISRCQVITLNPNQNQGNINDILLLKREESEVEIMKTNTIDFLYNIEKYGIQAIVNEKKDFFEKFCLTEDVIDFFSLAISFYKDVINYKLNRNIEYYDMKDIKYFSEKNTFLNLNTKLQILLTAKKNIKINANLNLLIDKLIMELGDVQDEKYCWSKI